MMLGPSRAALLKAFVSTFFVDSNFQGLEMVALKIFSEGLSLVWKIFIKHQIIFSSFKRGREKERTKCIENKIVRRGKRKKRWQER
jgi:hypothetical protein